MTIITKRGSLLDAKGIIVHGCNCQGVMGSGVALAMKTKWPVVYQRYRAIWSRDGLKLGDVDIIPVDTGVFVANALTQQFYGNDGKRYVNYDAVADAFATIRRFALATGHSVNFPLLGAVLG